MMVALSMMLLLGLSSAIDLGDFNEFDDQVWGYFEVFERVRQDTVHFTGVSSKSGDGYLAVICTGPGEIELRASVGRYIGMPRSPRPFRVIHSGGEQELSPSSRADYFWWKGDEANELIELFTSENMISARFELWDRSIHVARYSLAGSKARIRELRGKCR